MKKEQMHLIALVRSALGNKKIPDSVKDLSEEEYMAMMIYAKKQDLFPFLQYFDCFAKGQCRDDFFNTFLSGVLADDRQAREKQILLDAFEENGIYCMPLKGSITKTMYPVSELRTMGDLDILYKIEQTSEVKAVMKKLGYEYAGEASKHDHYQKPGVIVEMHKALLPAGSAGCAYFENVWARSKAEAGKAYVCQMDFSDHYIFTLCHLMEHFIRGGIGIRMVLDIYILSRQPGFNKTYISEQLKMMGLDIFEEKIRVLGQLWFGKDNGECRAQEEMYADLADYIADGGTFGKPENEMQNHALRYHSSFQYLVKQFFPSYKVMQTIFVWLKSPLLLPAAWVCRFWNVCTKRRENIPKQFQHAARMERRDADAVIQRKVLFEKCGLKKTAGSER